MKNTTLCYIEQDDKYLMLHRVKKVNDQNHDKWIGVGGKFEPGESPEDCLLREVKEETGLTLKNFSCRGIVTFVSDICETEYMHLFTATEYEGELQACDEGELVWVSKADIEKLEIWEGDKVFFRLLDESKDFFSLKLRYEGETLAEFLNESVFGADAGYEMTPDSADVDGFDKFIEVYKAGFPIERAAVESM